MSDDEAFFAAVFQSLVKQMLRRQDVLLRKLLESGFVYDGETFQLVRPPGISVPRQLDRMSISITTTCKGPTTNSRQTTDSLSTTFRIRRHRI